MDTPKVQLIITDEERGIALAKLTNKLLVGYEPKYKMEYNYGPGLYEPKPPFGWGQ
jgi:hypothetical protein